MFTRLSGLPALPGWKFAFQAAARRAIPFLACLAVCVALPLFGQTPPPFQNPPNINYTGGTLDMAVFPASVPWAGQTIRTNVYSATYNGSTYQPSYTPPTIRILNTTTTPLLQLQLRNRMSDVNCIEVHGQQFTNLHYHGFEVSPVPPSDNVTRIKINQGASYLFKVPFPQIVGSKHPEGMFWYHPHPHGCSSAQVNQGMSGILIVGDLLKDKYPGFVGIREQILLLKDGKPTPVAFKEEDNNILAFAANPEAPVVEPRITVNGLNQPRMLLQRGVPQFFRIGNVGANAYVNLAIPGVDAFIIAVDGMATAGPIKLDSSKGFILPPGSRVEMIVIPGIVGTFNLISLPLPTAFTAEPEVLATLGVAPTTRAAQAGKHDYEAELQNTNPAPAPFYPTPDKLEASSEADQCQILTPSGDPRYTFIFTQVPPKFMINGKQYEEDRVDVKCPIPSVPTWTVFNDTTVHHTFHIHQIHFQVLEINGVPVKPEEAPIRDNVDLPPHSVVKMRLPFEYDYLAGEFVLHCHILAHEDRGMMMNIVLFKP